MEFISSPASDGHAGTPGHVSVICSSQYKSCLPRACLASSIHTNLTSQNFRKMLERIFSQTSTDGDMTGTPEEEKYIQPPSSYMQALRTIQANSETPQNTKNDTGCPCHSRYIALKNAVQGVAAKYDHMSRADQESKWWNWTVGRVDSMLGIVQVSPLPLTCSGGGGCICHDVYALLRTKIRELADTDTYLQKPFIPYPDARKTCWESHAAEIKLLNAMCRDCRGKKEVPRGNAEIEKLMMEIGSFRAEGEGLK